MSDILSLNCKAKKCTTGRILDGTEAIPVINNTREGFNLKCNLCKKNTFFENNEISVKPVGNRFKLSITDSLTKNLEE